MLILLLYYFRSVSRFLSYPWRFLIVFLHCPICSSFCLMSSSLFSRMFFICNTVPSISIALEEDYNSTLTIFYFCFISSLIKSCNFLLFLSSVFSISRVFSLLYLTDSTSSLNASSSYRFSFFTLFNS